MKTKVPKDWLAGTPSHAKAVQRSRKHDGKAAGGAKGAAKAVEAASLTDIARVEGISTAVARPIYGFFHPEG